MIIVDCPCRPSVDRSQIVAIFGVGLVGGAIMTALERAGGCSASYWPLDWHAADLRARHLARLSRTIAECRDRGEGVDRIDVVWAAGKAGFTSSREELDSETQAFREILSWARNLRSSVPGARLHFHMLSSGGGLFEGQRFVEDASLPDPQRPYGHAKLEQERLLQQSRGVLGIHVYRPSSIYGFNGTKGRAGLVNTLIENAKKHETSRIFGDLATLRDYVLSSDVGDFIARRIMTKEIACGTFTLASGKPTSIKEMLEIAGKSAGRPLYLKLDSKPTNARHIAYRASVLPANWHPTDLQTGIRQLARQLSLSFAAGLRHYGMQRSTGAR